MKDACERATESATGVTRSYQAMSITEKVDEFEHHLEELPVSELRSYVAVELLRAAVDNRLLAYGSDGRLFPSGR